MLQKLLSLILASFILVKTDGQITKGNFLLGGNISFSSTSYHSEIAQSNKFYILQIAPSAGYFFLDKIALGIKANLSFSGLKAIGTDVYGKDNSLAFGPFARYYFLPKEKQINIVFEGTYLHAIQKGNNYESHRNILSFLTGPVVFFNSSVGLEFLIGYSSSKFSGFKGRDNTIQAGLGLQVHLEKEK